MRRNAVLRTSGRIAMVVMLGGLASTQCWYDIDQFQRDRADTVEGDGGPTVHGESGVQEGDADAPTTPCQGLHLLCDDFNGPTSLDSWLVDRKNGGQAAIDVSDSVSAPGSLLITLPGSGRPEATLTRTLPPATPRVACRFMFRLSPSSSTPIRVFAMHAKGDYPEYAVILGVSDGSIVLTEFGRKTSSEPINVTHVGDSLTDGWQAIELDVRLGTNATGTLSIDGRTPSPITLLSNGGGAIDSITLGLTPTDALSVATTARVDDLVCDVP